MPVWLQLDTWPITALVAVLLTSTVVIGVAGLQASKLASRIVAITTLGPALVGAVLLGAGTSIPEAVITVRSSLQGNYDVAISNAVGGVVIQTVMLVMADGFMRRRNVEDASRHHTPILQAALLIIMLGAIVLAGLGPQVALWVLHPASLMILVVYVTVHVLVRKAGKAPAWVRGGVRQPPADAGAAGRGEPVRHRGAGLSGTLFRFAVAMTTLGLASFALTDSATLLGERTGLSQTIVGGLILATATSLPELVTAIGAIRAQAATMAISNVLGGNLFDSVFPVLADVIQGTGSVYGHLDARTLFLAVLAMVVTSMLLVEIAQPPRRGLLGVGAMGIAITAVALGGYAAVLVAW